jgi:opacity protein-like surface antigen
MSLSIRRLVIAAAVSGGFAAGNAQAMTILEAEALYTVANLQSYFPGFTALQYANTSAAINTAHTNASCVAWFNQGDIFSPMATSSAAGLACSAFLDPLLDAATGMPPGTDYSALKLIFASYTTRIMTPIISLQMQQATTFRQADTISNLLSGIGNPRAASGPKRFALNGDAGIKGMAAGDTPTRWNGWFTIAANDIKNDFVGAGYSGDVTNFMGGADYSLGQNWVVGVSFASERTKLATAYNKGSLQSDSIMLAPYLGYRIDDTWSVDASAGYAMGKSKVTWAFGTASRSTSVDLSRNFAAINLNAIKWIGDWQVTGRGGIIRSQEQFDANASLLSDKITNTLTKLKIGGRVGYWVNNVMPYASISFDQDLQQSSGYDKLPDQLKGKTGYSLTLGVDLFSMKNITGGIAYTSEQGRSHLKNDSLMGMVAYRF